MQSLIYISFLGSSIDELPDNIDFVFFPRFKALRIVSNNFAVPLEFNLLLNAVNTSLEDIVLCPS